MLWGQSELPEARHEGCFHFNEGRGSVAAVVVIAAELRMTTKSRLLQHQLRILHQAQNTLVLTSRTTWTLKTLLDVVLVRTYTTQNIERQRYRHYRTVPE